MVMDKQTPILKFCRKTILPQEKLKSETTFMIRILRNNSFLKGQTKAIINPSSLKVRIKIQLPNSQSSRNFKNNHKVPNTQKLIATKARHK